MGCSNFLAWEQKCPGILFFNPAISQCDFPENVDCHQNSVDQLIKLRDVDPTPSPTFKCPEEEGLYPNPTDCSKFYQCFNHVAWAGQCPANLYFNPSLKVCDFPEKVDCHQNSNDGSFKLRDEEPTPSPRFNCPTKEGFYPDATECSKFFQCSNFLAWEQKCPGILFFNPAISQCDFPENVDCHQNSVDQLIKLRDVDPT